MGDLVPSQTILSTDEVGSVAPPIFTSVGQNGVNGPGDVFVIQSLLNKRLPKPHTDVPVTGVMDPGTILAIKAFQAIMMSMNPPSGFVAPGSPTYYALAARPLVTKETPPPTQYGHVGIVPPQIIEAAKASAQRWKVPAAVTIAQWIVESAWGSAMPPDSNNPFGIKALDDQPAVESGTWEVIDGKSVTVTARFRRFASLSEAFDAHGKLLATASPYKAAMELIRDPDQFADALTGVYATDPQYGTTLKWVMDNYKLKQYDL
ncbi:MAG: glucosaminidase domain-containing protein [Alphaproteobacteria bacterium]|nr:glucosaminidase domain-containing protein [Alphaproteobacteria bacterium]MBV8410738.1 glucosaminidase domain-containing protein [Alphaproteobacteria bacterium]